MNKIILPQKLSSVVKSGHSIMVGGFGLSGVALTLIQELESIEVKDLTIISNNLNGLGKVLEQGKIKKAIGSYFTTYPEIGKRFIEGLLEVELLPQGTLSEAIRAGGAGIGGFYTKTGVGTEIEKEKEVREIDGEKYLFQKPLRADIALIRAYKADELGNLTYYKTARNFNPMMATAAKTVIAEVDEIVFPGQLNPEEVVTPHAYVDFIVESKVKLEVEHL